MIMNGNEIFYHYTSVNGLFGIIENSCLHATHISFLNDPTEEEYFNTVLGEILSKNKIAEYTYKMLHNSSYEKVYDNYEKYIISFCELSDSLPMWNHYSKGNGYNLGIRLDKVMNRTKELESVFSHKIKIVYDKNEQLQLLTEYLEKHLQAANKYAEYDLKMEECQKLNQENEYQYYSYEQTELIAGFMDNLSVIKKMFKHPSYANEGEIRLIVEPDHEFNKLDYRKTENGVIIPFIKIPILIKDDVVSITLHPLQNHTGLNGVKHFLRSKGVDLKEKISISQIPFRNI